MGFDVSAELFKVVSYRAGVVLLVDGSSVVAE